MSAVTNFHEHSHVYVGGRKKKYCLARFSKAVALQVLKDVEVDDMSLSDIIVESNIQSTLLPDMHDCMCWL